RLRERLPAAMIPAAIVPLAALPLLPNGKLDAAALPSPEAFAAAEGAAFAAPRTPSEELLAVLWSEVLGASRIGRHDDFFDLGGHSLRATQLVSRIRKAFRVELPLRDLFRAPTVALLAARLDELRRAGAGPAAPPLRARERAGLPGEPLPLSFAQSRLWFYDRLNPGSSVFNLPVAILFRGRLDVPALARTLGEIVDRHEVLRTTFRLADGEEPVQAIGEPWAVPLPTADLVALRTAGADRIEAETRRLLALEGARPFDLARGPLLRALLVRRGPDESVGLLNLHHIASDGWSTGVLVGEVAALYPALAAGRPSPLPELPIQYADFALWQRGWLAGETLAAEVAWWRERLAGAPERLEMPAGRPRPAALTYRGASVSRLAAQELGIALSALARRQGATPFMVAFAAGSLLVSWWTGERDLVIGTDVANRNRQETEGLIGFFVNQLALRVRLAPGSTFLDLLAEVREAALGAYAHQDLPFEQVVQALAPERSRAWSPLFQVKIDLHDTSALALELPGLEIGQLEVPRETAQLELILQVILGGDGRIRLAADFATDLFAPPAMARLLESFERLLGECTARPEAPLDELTAALTRAEREASLGEQRERRRARGAAFGGLRAGLADPDEARDAG
ncbi:MAG TPA: condensation domain-containing protein, partial [Thermoanaerobaculia bacterium]|nr:condensation domain-containing protein [Thermoanaerobaculia bacterium]